MRPNSRESWEFIPRMGSCMMLVSRGWNETVIRLGKRISVEDIALWIIDLISSSKANDAAGRTCRILLGLSHVAQRRGCRKISAL